jgi:hypothetical protein
MRDIDFSQDAISIIGNDDASHGIKEHFQHAARTQGGANNARDSLGGGNVAQLRLTTRLALSLTVCVF